MSNPYLFDELIQLPTAYPLYLKFYHEDCVTKTYLVLLNLQLLHILINHH